MSAITSWIVVCGAAFVVLVVLLRRDRLSLGLPVAYMVSLLMIHVPGAYAHLVGGGLLSDSGVTKIGMRFAAIGAISFVIGVRFACFSTAGSRAPPSPNDLIASDANRRRFSLLCLVGGWLFIYGLGPLRDIPSLGAAIYEGGAIWMLGVMLGLRDAIRRGNLRKVCFWLGALTVFPVGMLLLHGFLSYGSAAVIIVGSVLAISARRYWHVAVGIVIVGFLSLTVFVNYFENRSDIRHEVWGGAPLEDRVDTILNIASNSHWFDAANEEDLCALDARLNQNFFVGLAARRIREGQVSYLYGRSIWQGIEALVPRAFWPDKPVSAGSPEIVSEMTGLQLSSTTSFGIGNVMEFQINFGLEGVIGGFLILGWLIGMLDRKAAAAERAGDFGRTALFFLPAVALIDPGGSIVEMASGSAAAIVAAFGWRWVWEEFPVGSRASTRERAVIHRSRP